LVFIPDRTRIVSNRAHLRIVTDDANVMGFDSLLFHHQVSLHILDYDAMCGSFSEQG